MRNFIAMFVVVFALAGCSSEAHRHYDIEKITHNLQQQIEHFGQYYEVRPDDKSVRRAELDRLYEYLGVEVVVIEPTEGRVELRKLP